MKTIIIQARMNSSRLPGKVLEDLGGMPLLSHVIMRARKSKLADQVIVATSTEKSDDPIAALCGSVPVACYRGSLNNVLERYVHAAREYKATTIVRITADCPLIDPGVIDRCIAAFEASGADYISNVVPEPRTFPRGFDVEVFSFEALLKAQEKAIEVYEQEHVTPVIWQNKRREFKVGPTITASSEYARPYRLCVDYEDDYALLKRIYEQFYSEGEIIDVPKLLAFLDEHPEWLVLNSHRESRS